MNHYVSGPWATHSLAMREVAQIALTSTSYKPYPIPLHLREYYENLAREINDEHSSSEEEEEEEDWGAFDDVEDVGSDDDGDGGGNITLE